MQTHESKTVSKYIFDPKAFCVELGLQCGEIFNRLHNKRCPDNWVFIETCTLSVLVLGSLFCSRGESGLYWLLVKRILLFLLSIHIFKTVYLRAQHYSQIIHKWQFHLIETCFRTHRKSYSWVLSNDSGRIIMNSKFSVTAFGPFKKPRFDCCPELIEQSFNKGFEEPIRLRCCRSEQPYFRTPYDKISVLG